MFWQQTLSILNVFLELQQCISQYFQMHLMLWGAKEIDFILKMTEPKFAEALMYSDSVNLIYLGLVWCPLFFCNYLNCRWFIRPCLSPWLMLWIDEGGSSEYSNLTVLISILPLFYSFILFRYNSHPLMQHWADAGVREREKGRKFRIVILKAVLI